MRSRIATVGLYYRTIRHLRPEQIVHRVRLRTKKAMYQAAPSFFERRWRPVSTPSVHWPSDFVPLDLRLPPQYPDAESNARGTFEFPLGARRDLGQPIDWRAAHAPQLWRYNLHYWEWSFSFVAHPDRAWARSEFIRLWRSWRSATVVGRWDEWSPYVVALRAWVFCSVFDVLVRDSDAESDFLRDVEMHANFLSANVELDVGGNHLIKNLKALVGLGAFLGNEVMLQHALGRLEQQLPIQIFGDGGHYERSPSYHCQVLADLIDVSALLRAAGRRVTSQIDDTIASMRRWLGIMLMPDGDVPLFNDCVLVGTDRIELLEPAPRPPDRLVVLRETGYAVMRPDDRIHLVADVGDPCPPDLPAHAHADCLSFILAVDGERLLVDPGVTTYEPGPQRDWERSTAAHNTIEIDGENQTEVWGAFRAGRLAHTTIHEALEQETGCLVLRASHDGYRSLAGQPEHYRTFRVLPHRVVIDDEVRGNGVHATTWSLVLSDSAAGTVLAGGADLGVAPIQVRSGFAYTGAPTHAPPGATSEGTSAHRENGLRFSACSGLPVRFRIEVVIDGGCPEVRGTWVAAQ